MKKVRLLAMVLLTVLLLTGCQRSISYGYKVDTGDIIIIKLDLTKGYTIDADQQGGTFRIMDKENTVILDGFFVNKEAYEKYISVVNEGGCRIIERDPMKGVTVTQYQFVAEDHTENNFICWMDGSKTGIVIASISSLEEAEAAFDSLTLKLD